MRTSLFGPILFASTLAACSSSTENRGRTASTSADAGGDAGHTTADGAAADGAAACELKDGAEPDFVVTLSEDMKYDGPVTLEAADAGAQTLVGQRDGGAVHARFGGAAPPIPEGKALWASLLQSTTHANPYNSTTVSHATVSAGEHGPVLAEALRQFVYDPSTTTFLGVKLDDTLLCSRREITNTVTQTSCLTTDVYSVTIHGDSDLTLTPASEGHVKVHGIEYDVWLSAADTERMDYPGSGAPCISDWAPMPGLVLAGRAVRYGDVLK